MQNVKTNIIRLLIGATILIACTQKNKDLSQESKDLPNNSNSLFEHKDMSPRWSSAENMNGAKGAGGQENNGAKGRPSVSIEAGESFDLIDTKGMGIISRIWITISDRSPEMLRSLKLEMFWDDESKPAVSVPLGDFFSVGLGRTTSFENELFANPEGRSFNCFIPMPFKKAARISVTNESEKRLHAMFFDVDYQLIDAWQEDYLYFHAYWSRDTATTLAKDFKLLPKVSAKGRFLGVNVGINPNPLYENTWWGEGEVKIYFDGDTDLPSLVGTGTEDYIGTAWGQGKYITRYTGCPIADNEKNQWSYYRFHIPDPVYFNTDCKVTIQQMGGAQFPKANELQNRGVPMIPVTIITDEIHHIYKKDSIVDLDDPSLPHSWTNFYRSDDVSATAYLYLDKPSDDLPALQNVAIRTYNLKTEEAQ